MDELEEVKQALRESNKNAFMEAIEKKRYTTVIGFLKEEILEMMANGVSLKDQLVKVNDVLSKHNIEINYKTYSYAVKNFNSSNIVKSQSSKRSSSFKKEKPEPKPDPKKKDDDGLSESAKRLMENFEQSGLSDLMNSKKN